MENYVEPFRKSSTENATSTLKFDARPEHEAWDALFARAGTILGNLGPGPNVCYSNQLKLASVTVMFAGSQDFATVTKLSLKLTKNRHSSISEN
jgi:hypothetical protein